MPVDTSIIGRIQQPQFMTPAQAVSLQQLARQGQIQEMTMREQQREMQVRQATQALYRDPQNIEPQTGQLSLAGINQLNQIDPAAGQAAAQHRAATLSQLSAKQIAAQERKREESDRIEKMTWGAYQSTIDQTGGNAQEAMRKATEVRNAEINRLRESGLGASLGITDADYQKESAAPVDLDRLRAKYGVAAPQSNLGKLKADFAAGRIDKATYDRAVAKATAPTATMSLTGEGALTDDALNLAVDQYMAGDSTAAQGYARNAQMKAAFMNRLAQRAKAKGMSGGDIAQKTAEFQGMKAGQRTLGTRTANVEMAVTEAQNVMPIAVEASEKVNRTQYPTLNAVLIAAEKGTGDENVVRLAAATNSLVNIYARAISPSGSPTVSDKDHAREILSTAYSKGQFRAATDIMSQELAAARKSPGQVKESMRGEGGDLKSKVEASGWTYEPDKYEYREVGGKVQRKRKGG